MTSWVRPATLDEALDARRDHPDWMVLAGGTDLLVGAGETPPDVPGVIDLFGLAPLTEIREGADGISVGGGATFEAILRSDLVRRALPALAEASREIGAVQIQARGTLGGNVVTSSPVGDSLPVLLAYDAVIDVVSARGARSVPYGEFITGYRTTALEPDELVLAVRFPTPPPPRHSFWRKVGTRSAQAISKVMMAGAAVVRDDGTCHDVRIAFGAVADRPVRIAAAEAVVEGRSPRGLASEVADAVRAAITPIDDVRSTADYRRWVAGNLAARFVTELGKLATA